MPEKITVYGHPACPGVGPVKGVLNQTKVEYDYINIRQDPEAAALVREINQGYESVPTLVFPDGSTLTEPGVGELSAKLKTMGYRVGPIAWLIGNFQRILIGAILMYALLSFLEVI